MGRRAARRPDSPVQSKTDRWIEYIFRAVLARLEDLVDNSTNPVTVWYGDHNGYIVRIQPLE